MNSPETPALEKKLTTKERGIALITVLAILMLTSVLIMAFFSISQNELTASTSYSQGQEAQQLSQSAINIVIHQLRAATENVDVAWASQPGMIRTWDENGLAAAYKLYSDDTMVAKTTKEFTDDENEIKNWEDNPGVYVDLNEPVIREDNVYFPILDPAAKSDKPMESVEGFDYNLQMVGGAGPTGKGLPMPVKWLYQLEDGTLGTLDSNGKFQGLTVNTDEGQPNDAGKGVPGPENPIVSRFAFWTDDETAKVNINTAAGGLPWDTPRAGGITDREYALTPPLQHEYQRYPGHPATTSMMPVLFPNRQRFGRQGYDKRAAEKMYDLIPRIVIGSLEPGKRPKDDPDPLVPDRHRLYASLDEILFRAAKDGPMDRSGSNTLPRGINPLPFTNSGGSAQQFANYLDRLRFFVTTHNRSPETTVFNTPRISIWPTYFGDPGRSSDKKYFSKFDRRIRFCGEVGVAASGYTSPTKRAQYYFQRQRSDHPTHDYDNIVRNQHLYKYLQWLTDQKIPGLKDLTGQSLKKAFTDKWSKVERDQILTEVFDYFRSANLYDDTILAEHGIEPTIPGKDRGHGGIVNATENPADHITYTNYRIKPTGNQKKSHRQQPGHGQVTPIEIDGGSGITKGFGRMHHVTEVGVAFICCAEGSEQLGGVGKTGWKHDNRKWMRTTDSYYSNVCPLTRKVPTDLKDPKLTQGDKSYVDGLYFNAGVTALDQRPSSDQELWSRVTEPGNWNMALAYDMPLKSDEKKVQGILLIQMFCPSQGWTGLNPDFRLDVEIPNGFEISNAVTGETSVPDGKFQWPSKFTWATPRRSPVGWGIRDNGGYLDPRTMLMGQNGKGQDYRPRYTTWKSSAPAPGGMVLGDNSGKYDMPSDQSFSAYPWVTPPIKVKKDQTLNVTMGEIILTLWPSGGYGSDGAIANLGNDDYTQRVTLDMADFRCPTPNLAAGHRGPTDPDGIPYGNALQPTATWILNRDGSFPPRVDPDEPGRPRNPGREGRINRFTRSPGHDGALVSGRQDSVTPEKNWRFVDVTRSYVIRHGDNRLTHVMKDVGSKTGYGTQVANFNGFVPWADDNAGANYGSAGWWIGSNFTQGANSNGFARGYPSKRLVPGTIAAVSRRPHLPDTFTEKSDNRWGDFDNTMAIELDGAYINKPDEGNSQGVYAVVYHPWKNTGGVARLKIPFFTTPWVHTPSGPSYYSPNRILPSPGMIGSLSSGAKSSEPWQTLLFRRQGTGINGEFHPGMDNPKDHYLLDFFWMPVVEPWSISEPLSTDGKINLNYQLAPFGHIKRESGMRAVFYTEQMLTVPNDMGKSYLAGSGWGAGYDHKRDRGGDLRNVSLRSYIDPDQTLRQFRNKFGMNERTGFREKGKVSKIFVTASEICEQWLVPEPVRGLRLKPRPSLETMESLWNPESRFGLGLVGDNSRERPYSNILPRITTKSNTFQIHFRAQMLRQSIMSPNNPNNRRSTPEWSTFDERTDQVVSEYRGSTIIERYVDPNDPRIPDYASELQSNGGAIPQNLKGLDYYYRFRVVGNRRFAP